MGSLVVKLDAHTRGKLENMTHYTDVDMISPMSIGVKMDGSGSMVPREVPMTYDVQAVKASVRNILMWRVGESVIRPEFGHKLSLSMYSQMNDFNKDAVCEEIKRAIEDNEPRVEIHSVSVKRGSDEDDNALHVKLTYSVVGNKAADAKIVEETTILGK